MGVQSNTRPWQFEMPFRMAIRAKPTIHGLTRSRRQPALAQPPSSPRWLVPLPPTPGKPSLGRLGASAGFLLEVVVSAAGPRLRGPAPRYGAEPAWGKGPMPSLVAPAPTSPLGVKEESA